MKPTACKACAEVKTKCNQVRPVCGRCQVRGLTCEYAPGPLHAASLDRVPPSEKGQVPYLSRVRGLSYCKFADEMVSRGGLPKARLLDAIHEAASRQAPPMDPSGAIVKGYYNSLDGSTLLLFGLFAEELIEHELAKVDAYRSKQ